MYKADYMEASIRAISEKLGYPLDKYVERSVVEVLIGHDAANYLKRLSEPMKSRVKASIANLAKEPPEGDIKKLTGMDGYRARVGGLRILFKITGDIVKIHSIVPRGQAYNKKEKGK